MYNYVFIKCSYDDKLLFLFEKYYITHNFSCKTKMTVQRSWKMLTLNIKYQKVFWKKNWREGFLAQGYKLKEVCFILISSLKSKKTRFHGTHFNQTFICSNLTSEAL